MYCGFTVGQTTSTSFARQPMRRAFLIPTRAKSRQADTARLYMSQKSPFVPWCYHSSWLNPIAMEPVGVVANTVTLAKVCGSIGELVISTRGAP
jgi:hypothetical protein